MHWLLMLGSELAYDRSLDAALVALRELGDAQPLTETRITAAREGGAGRYHNRLVRFAHPGPHEAVVAQLKQIELRFGRGTQPGVPLDIDVLAQDKGHGWRPDARALAKREFDYGHVRQLLAEAGLDALIAQAAAHG